MRRCRACHKRTVDRRGVCMSCRTTAKAHASAQDLQNYLAGLGRCRVRVASPEKVREKRGT